MEKLVTVLSKDLLKGLKTLSLTFADGSAPGFYEMRVPLSRIEGEGSSVRWYYECDAVKEAYIEAAFHDGSVLFSAHIEAEAALSAANAVTIPFSVDFADAVLESWHEYMHWMGMGFPKSTDELQEGIQNMLLQKGSLHYSVTMLCGDYFKGQADSHGLHLVVGSGDCKELNGPFMIVTPATDPIKAVEYNYKAARRLGAINVPLREEKEFPALFEKFGWCTWDACYHEVTSKILYEKMEEAQEKGLPIKWILIDDGWSQYKDMKLTGLECDYNKFPEGLKECIRRLKEEYGVEKVGVWHAFPGYWEGIMPDSDLYKEFSDCFMMNNTGWIVPSDDPDKAYRFWDAWHSYLEDCGVDFVKVDVQSSISAYLSNTVPTTPAARHAHEALERSVNKHFGGRIINCMGMDMANIFGRTTAMARNSGDFFPHKENGFAKHAQTNGYNAMWHSQMQFCDYDMWWSGRSMPVQSGVLRAISGGPVYVSDQVGESELANILPICGETGELWRTDHAALPTYDCIYVNCEESGKPFKLYSRKGENVAMAAFNLSRRDIEDEFDYSVIPDLSEDTDYMAYEYFSKTWQRVHFAESCSLQMKADEVQSYSLYPIHYPDEASEDGAYILCGDLSRYVSAATPEEFCRKVLIEELL